MVVKNRAVGIDNVGLDVAVDALEEAGNAADRSASASFKERKKPCKED